jgi:chromosome segregation ATPase
MTLRTPDKPARYSSSAIALVECSVQVSPTLARLVRKSAEKEAGGASAKDALLAAAGIQPGELTTLRKEVEQASGEAGQWREQAAREHRQLEQTTTAVAQQDKERATLRADLRKATDALNDAQRQIRDLKGRIGDLATVLESRDAQLAHSLSLLGLDDGATTAVTMLRDRLAQGDIRFPSNSIAEVEAMIANLGQPEMKALSVMLARRAWRIRIIRWLLRVQT